MYAVRGKLVTTDVGMYRIFRTQMGDDDIILIIMFLEKIELLNGLFHRNITVIITLCEIGHFSNLSLKSCTYVYVFH